MRLITVSIWNIGIRSLSGIIHAVGNNYLPKCWKVLFSKPRFIEIFFSSSEVRASAEIVPR